MTWRDSLGSSSFTRRPNKHSLTWEKHQNKGFQLLIRTHENKENWGKNRLSESTDENKTFQQTALKFFPPSTYFNRQTCYQWKLLVSKEIVHNQQSMRISIEKSRRQIDKISTITLQVPQWVLQKRLLYAYHADLWLYILSLAVRTFWYWKWNIYEPLSEGQMRGFSLRKWHQNNTWKWTNKARCEPLFLLH